MSLSGTARSTRPRINVWVFLVAAGFQRAAWLSQISETEISHHFPSRVTVAVYVFTYPAPSMAL
jgi:xanthine/uracil/vitamin C permease (AzgA family)